MSEEGKEVEEWLELGNGCICCSVKDTGVNAIESLMDRRGNFDYIILETSGLAEPGNLAPLFWVDEGLGSSIYLDGIVTLVDAKNIILSLEEKPPKSPGALLAAPGDVAADAHGHHETTAHLQISHADVVLINKCDTVTSDQLFGIEARIRSINGLANVHKTSYGQIPNLDGVLLDLHAYDAVDKLDMTQKGHSHLDPVRTCGARRSSLLTLNQQTISTVTLGFPSITTSQLQALEQWLRVVLWESQLPVIDSGEMQRQLVDPTFSIHRTKGRLVLHDPPRVRMLQGVREVFDITDFVDGDTAAAPGSKIVLIGRGLDPVAFQSSLETALSIMSS